MLMGGTEKGICLLEYTSKDRWDRQKPAFHSHFGTEHSDSAHPLLTQLLQELTEYFDGERKDFTVPLDLRGTEFQVQVWEELCKKPWGKRTSYGEISKQLGIKNGQRAVGRANGDNRIAIVVPCHRVVAADGTMCGYGGGIWRKKALLEIETNHAQGSLF